VLSNEGLVSHIPNHGASVRNLTEFEIVDLFRFREVIEVAAVDALFGSSDRAALLNALGTTVEMLGNAAADADYSEVYRLDSEFHEVIVTAIDSRRCVREYRAVRNELRVVLNRFESYDGYLGSAYAEHLELHQLLCRGRRADCRKALRQHLSNAMAQVLGSSGDGDEPARNTT
jgi:DNA-binding GntR family transcriptional regulator